MTASGDGVRLDAATLRWAARQALDAAERRASEGLGSPSAADALRLLAACLVPGEDYETASASPEAPACTVYQPLYGPQCDQCGRPRDAHTHDYAVGASPFTPGEPTPIPPTADADPPCCSTRRRVDFATEEIGEATPFEFGTAPRDDDDPGPSCCICRGECNGGEGCLDLNCGYCLHGCPSTAKCCRAVPPSGAAAPETETSSTAEPPIGVKQSSDEHKPCRCTRPLFPQDAYDSAHCAKCSAEGPTEVKWPCKFAAPPSAAAAQGEEHPA